jgi:glycosyltransferase involved in cell wall biosynthesis
MQESVAPMSLSVIIPAYNEESTLESVVRKVLKLPQVSEVIIVDDGSTDATPRICLELACIPRVRAVRLPRNQGKCAALKAGLAISSGEIVIVQDADLEYDPNEIPYVIQPILEGVADVVYGSRFLVRRAARVLYFYHYVANKGLTLFSNLFTNINFTDVETGYKAFRGEIIRNMVITSKGFGIEIEVTAKMAKLGCAIYEVPISYYGRTYAEGKKIGFSDGLMALWYVIKYNLFCSLKSSFVKLPGKPR